MQALASAKMRCYGEPLEVVSAMLRQAYVWFARKKYLWRK